MVVVIDNTNKVLIRDKNHKTDLISCKTLEKEELRIQHHFGANLQFRKNLDKKSKYLSSKRYLNQRVVPQKLLSKPA